MKKISTVALLLLCAIGFAQDDVKKSNITVSPYYLWSEPTQFGLSFELNYSAMPGLEGTSSILNVGYGTMTYEEGGSESDGDGYVIELGSRGYFNKKDYGIYSQNTLAYGNIKFEEVVGGEKFKGTYSYFSFFSPTVGYKFKFGENLSIDPSVGVQWVIQMKGSGFVDNKNVDEWAGRFGIKVGYTF
jgi:Autotransporter beta-domain